MPEINLYQPHVINGVLEKLTDPAKYTWLGNVPTINSPYPVAEWDVVRGSRQISKLNTPNAEAHIVPRMGQSHQTHSFAYIRDKKVLEPTTLYWLRSPGTTSNQENAEKAVMREVTDLNQRVDNAQEWALWQAIQGQLVYNDAQGAANVVDYQMPASHKATATTAWATADYKAIIADVTSMKRLVNKDGRVSAKDAYAGPGTIDTIISAFAGAGNGSLLSDRMKDLYYTGGTLPGFLNLAWHPVDETYDTEDQTDSVQYFAEGKVLFGDFKTNDPVHMAYGPTADTDAPQGHTGKFSKSRQDFDPAARVILIELNFLPVVTRPEQIAILSVA